MRRAFDFGVLVAAALLALAGCGGGGATFVDGEAPATTAVPRGGSYDATQQVTLTSSEPATIYYSTDGSQPEPEGANTLSGRSPLADIVMPDGTTRLQYFAVDDAGNREPTRSQTYVVDALAPTITFTSGTPAPVGLLASQVLRWQSDEAGQYEVELGGTGTPGTGTVLSSGSVESGTSVAQTIEGTQLSLAGATPLWVRLTDDVGHIGSHSVGLMLKPRVPIDMAGGAGQIAMLPNGRKAYVTNPGDDTVTVIDTDPASGTYHSVLGIIPVGITPLNVAATPDGTRVYVTNNGRTIADLDSISVISTSTDTVLTTIPLGPTSSPNGIAITPDGTRAYFLSFQEEISVLDVDPASATYHTVTATIPRILLLFGGIAITPNGARAVVSWHGMIAESVDIYDVDPTSPRYHTLLNAPVPLYGGASTDVAVTPDSRYAYVSDVDNQICRIDTRTFVTGPTGPWIGSSSFALTPDGNTILLGSPSHEDLQVLRASDLTLISSQPLGASVGSFGAIAFTPAGDRAYVSVHSDPAGSQVVMVPLE